MTSIRDETHRSKRHAGKRIYLAGASGVIGIRLVPLLVAAGYTVGAMTRSSEKADGWRRSALNRSCATSSTAPALTQAVHSFSPDLVLHELTDLPDAVEDLPKARLLNARIRVEGTANLIHAMDGLSQAEDRGPKHRVDHRNPVRPPTRSPHSRTRCSRRTAS